MRDFIYFQNLSDLLAKGTSLIAIFVYPHPSQAGILEEDGGETLG